MRKPHISTLVPIMALALTTVFFARTSLAEGTPDLSGRWTIDMPGEVDEVCRATIGQDGYQLRVVVACSLFPHGELEGIIHDTSGEFSLLGNIDGAQVAMVGTAAPDGTSMSGTWTTKGGVDGTFTGTRRPVVIGDVNDDGTVNSIDALQVLQLTAGMARPLPLWAIADVNNSGDVDSVDAALILQFEAGLLPGLPAA